MTTHAIKPRAIAWIDNIVAKGMADRVLPRVASLAELQTICFQQGSSIARMWFMAELALSFRKGIMKYFESVFLFYIRMTVPAELLLSRLDQEVLIRSVRGMTCRAFPLNNRWVDDRS